MLKLGKVIAVAFIRISFIPVCILSEYSFQFNSQQNAEAPESSPHLEAINIVMWQSFEHMKADPLAQMHCEV